MDMSVVAVIILCILQKDFRSGILKLFEGNFHQGIKLHIIYFSLTDISIRTVIILFQFICLLYTHIRVRLMTFMVFVISSLNFTLLLHQ